ncbi:DUF4123 domain-containing protein [Nostoc ellipsosporum NOK]|nr:DUF4123 domain-containing protein [Nostoc ellipsosporum NOK]
MRYCCFDPAINNEYTLLQLQQAYPVHRFLLEGTKDEKLWDAAPWLFVIDDNPYQRLQQPLISLKHCLFLESPDPPALLAAHLQAFIYKTINGKEHFFRLWDARVMDRYLANASGEELYRLFGESLTTICTAGDKENAFTCRMLNKQHRAESRSVPATELFGGQATDPEPPAAEPPPPEQKTEEVKPSRRRFFLD